MFLNLALPLLFAAGSFGQTVYFAGDSTMARGGGGSGTDGWAQYVGQYLTIPAVNMAIAGRSARSYTDEGRFTTLINTARSGDFAVIEFGHNDGLSGSVDNGRQDAFGDSLTTTAVVTAANGTQITIHTIVTNAVNSLKAKGVNVIVSSQTPTNDWVNGVIGPGARFVAGNTSTTYVDHYAYIANAYNRLGQSAVVPFFPIDHTHTAPAGALVVAQSFIRGLLCGASTLKARVNAAGQAVPSE
ncbi:Carbohydrate esterase family 12 protein [Mycena kentingensis (nom. inval.)]|nr:Carbohydrate esterase family 12 protein [Mycena kentingensis (nom. inval.)]